MREDLIRETRKYLSEKTGPCDLPDNCFNLKQFQGQGATSSSYILSIELPDREERRFFVKCYNQQNEAEAFWKDQLLRDYEISKVLSKIETERGLLRIVEPLFLLKDNFALVSEYVEGMPLSVYLFNNLKLSIITKIKNISEIEYIIKEVGLSLGGIHSLDYSLFTQGNACVSYKFSADFYSQKIDYFAEAIRKKIGDKKLLRDGVDYFNSTIEKIYLDNMSLTFEHSDFIPQNIIRDTKGHLFLHDFPNAGLGFGYCDLAHFISSLDDYTYLKTVDKRLVRRLMALFLTAYSEVRNVDWELLSAFLVYIQFYSTSILVAREVKPTLYKRFLLEHPVKKFENNISIYTDMNTLKDFLALPS